MTTDLRTSLLSAAINCEHLIDSDRVMLLRGREKQGNALSQLGDRLEAAALAAAPSTSPAAAPGMVNGLTEAETAAPTFGDALKIAKGCFDYKGGYDDAQLPIYHHGIGTVVAALTSVAKRGFDSQSTALHRIGSEAETAATASVAGLSPAAAAVAGEPDKWEGAEGWEPLAWALCAEENGEEACTELIWEGGPIKEPWGDRWMKYEGEAKRMIELVRKHCAPHPSPSAAERTPITKLGSQDDLITVANVTLEDSGPTLTLHLDQLGDMGSILGEEEAAYTVRIAPMRRGDFEEMGEFDGF